MVALLVFLVAEIAFDYSALRVLKVPKAFVLLIAFMLTFGPVVAAHEGGRCVLCTVRAMLCG